MKGRPRRDRSLGALPMVAMIDVVFQLLIFFLVTARLSAPESQIASALRAQRDGSGGAKDLQPQIVRVLQDEKGPVYYLGARRFREQEALRVALLPLPKDRGVFVRVASSARVDSVAIVLQACKDAGFTRVSYVPEISKPAGGGT